MNQLKVVDLVQICLEYEKFMPLVVKGPTAYPLSDIIKIQFPHFSKSHINRLIEQNAIKIEGNKIPKECIVFFEKQMVIQVGKRDYFLLKAL